MENNQTWDDEGFEQDPKNNEGFAEEKPQDAIDPKPQNAIIPKPQRPETKKKRSALFWFGVLSAGVLIVAVIGGGIYWLTRPSVEEEAFIASNNETAVSVPPTKDTTLQQVTTQEEIDSAIGTEPQTQEVKHDAGAIALLSGEQKAASSEQRVANTERKLENLKSPKPESTIERKTENPIERKTENPIERKTENPIERKTENPIERKTEKPVTPKPQPVIATKEGGKNALFVVQVFSSPSRDDADEWLQSLREKNVNDGYITEQKIKGQSWFRVRFGQFGTRESAESEALRLGFREPWIARVR